MLFIIYCWSLHPNIANGVEPWTNSYANIAIYQVSTLLSYPYILMTSGAINSIVPQKVSLLLVEEQTHPKSPILI